MKIHNYILTKDGISHRSCKIASETDSAYVLTDCFGDIRKDLVGVVFGISLYLTERNDDFACELFYKKYGEECSKKIDDHKKAIAEIYDSFCEKAEMINKPIIEKEWGQ